MTTPDTGEAPATGIVMIGRNEGERLLACLRSIAPLELPMVYVDSASTDGSQAAARAAGAYVVDLDLSRPFTAARARNEGAAALIGAVPALEFVQFVDGDCEIVDAWIAKAQATLRTRPEVVAVCGQRAERHPERSLYNRLCNEEWNTPVGEALACGGDAMMRVTAFTAVGGFDPSMIAHEEPELCARLRQRGGVILRIDAPMTLHDANILRFSQWWRRGVRAGFGYAQALRRAPGPKTTEVTILRRALIWSLLPVLILLTFLAGLPLLSMLIALLFPLQWIRLTLRERRLGYPLAMKTSALSLIGKFAEAFGAMKFCVDGLLGRRRGAILYK